MMSSDKKTYNLLFLNGLYLAINGQKTTTANVYMLRLYTALKPDNAFVPALPLTKSSDNEIKNDSAEAHKEGRNNDPAQAYREERASVSQKRADALASLTELCAAVHNSAKTLKDLTLPDGYHRR